MRLQKGCRSLQFVFVRRAKLTIWLVMFPSPLFGGWKKRAAKSPFITRRKAVAVLFTQRLPRLLSSHSGVLVAPRARKVDSSFYRPWKFAAKSFLGLTSFPAIATTLLGIWPRNRVFNIVLSFVVLARKGTKAKIDESAKFCLGLFLQPFALTAIGCEL